MSRTVSARIPKEMHEELRERCNKVGCTMTEWIEHAIEFCMQPEGSTDFDFGGYEEDEQESRITENTKTEENRKEIPTVKPTRISYDGGKTWTNLNEEKKKS